MPDQLTIDPDHREAYWQHFVRRPRPYRYGHVIRAVRETPWAIQPGRLLDILDVLYVASCGIRLTQDEIEERIGKEARTGNRAAAQGGVLVLGLRGIISHRIEQVNDISGPGGTSVEGFRKRFRDGMADPNVPGIVLDVDSPGGSVEGVPELASEIMAARGRKPVIAVANTLMASAAYWIGTAADEVSVTPSGEVGSVGVYAAHDDLSAEMEMRGRKRTLIAAGAFKTEGNPWEPLSDSAREHIQRRVDEVHDQFIVALASHRGVSQKRVREDFGRGRAFGADEALKRGMVDRIETLDAAIERVRAGAVKKRRMRSLALSFV